MNTTAKAKPITVDQLITEYAAPIANAVNLSADDYDRTATGLANLLRDAADDLLDQVSEWLETAADDLIAIDLLGDDGPKTQDLLKAIDRVLYEAKSDLELG